MARIEVNHQLIRELAESIDEYCEVHDKEMKKADNSVKAVLGSEWFGEDTVAFGRQWEGVDEADSVAGQMRKSLENYSEALKRAAKEYQTVQEDIYNLATLLLTW